MFRRLFVLVIVLSALAAVGTAQAQCPVFAPTPGCTRYAADGVTVTGLNTCFGSVIAGVAQNDIIIGTANPDSISGGGGDDIIIGLASGDFLYGNGGNDLVIGDGGPDCLDGAGGNDTLEGGAGADDLFGDGGTDHLAGGTGADFLDGGGQPAGTFDLCSGGPPGTGPGTPDDALPNCEVRTDF